MSILELFQRLVALAMDLVTQSRIWKEKGRRGHHSDAHYAEFPRSWSTRAERELQEMDCMFRMNRRNLGARTQFQRSQIPCQWQTPPPKYQLYRHEEGMRRTARRRVMVVSNPDLTDESEGELGMKTRKCI